MIYAFLLGRVKELSVAELKCLLPEKSIKYIGEDILLADVNIEKPQKFLNQLGGTIKIIQILKTSIKQDLLKKAQLSKKKILFAVNVHNIANPNEIRVKTKLITLKKILKENKITSGYINKKPMNASFVAIKKKGLIESETDYSYIKIPKDLEAKKEEQILEGVTVAIQDFENYSHRDYDRPERDARNGMLPPKIAQIMINIAGEDITTILDPFCGSGTIVQEALLMGKNAYGSDKSDKAVKDTKKNIKWLKKEFKVKNSLECDITVQDATTLKLPKKQKNVAIVAETALGPPMKQAPSKTELKSLHEKLKKLYVKVFEHLHENGAEGLKIVMAFPAHVLKNEIIVIPRLKEDIEAIGWKTVPLISEEKPSLIYKRKDQVVAREIFKFVLEK